MRMAIGGFLSAILRGTCLFGMRRASPQAQPIIGGAVPSQPIYPLLTRLCPEPIEVPFSKWEGFLSVGAEQSPVLRRECRSSHREFVEPPGLSVPITGGRPLGGMSR